MAGGERAQSIEAFQTYTHERIAHLKRLGGVLSEAMPVVTNLDTINGRLQTAGRTDLVMAGKAAMMHYASPNEVFLHTNNFAPKFRFTNAGVPTEDRWGHPVYPRIPVVEAELLAFKAKPDIPEDWDSAHANKPAFQRMLELFPDFTIPFIVAVSQQDVRWRMALFEADLYVAYQIMAKLVDPKDPYVMQKGSVDDWYLCR